MKRLFLFLLLIFSLSHVYADDFKRAQRILEWIKEGQGDSLVARFHPAIRATLPPPAINQIWAQLEEQAGSFERQEAWQSGRFDSLCVSQCRLTFKRDVVRFVLLTDSCDFIVGFHFNPISKPLQPYEKKRESMADYVEKDTFIINGRIKLPATLCLPSKSEGDCPIVVIVHGLGPTDKDGTLGPNKPYQEVARSFASRGIATFRYDKRTFVYGNRSFELGGILTYDTEVVDDAVLALDMAAHMPKVDKAKVFVLGHSLGGMLAPRIAMLSRVPLAGMISVASPARHMEDWLRMQFRYLAKVQGTSESQADSLTHIIYSKMPASYRSFAAEYNQIGTARGLDIPMLFLQGGHDFQVTEADFQMWKNGLKGCTNAHFVWLNGCDHLLRDIPEMAVPEIYMRPGCVSGNAIDEVVKFIQQ